MMLYLVPMYMSWSSIHINQNNHQQFRHYDVIYVKTVKNGKICNIFRNIRISPGLWQNFFICITVSNLLYYY